MVDQRLSVVWRAIEPSCIDERLESSDKMTTMELLPKARHLGSVWKSLACAYIKNQEARVCCPGMVAVATRISTEAQWSLCGLLSPQHLCSITVPPFRVVLSTFGVGFPLHFQFPMLSRWECLHSHS